MEQFIIYFALLSFGLCLGSFAGAQVWRLRAYQLKQDKTDGEHIDANEYKRLEKLTKTKGTKDRSQCLRCHYQLKWYDMIPLFSWISLRGKCRNCKKRIGYMEPLIEVGVALFFVLSYIFWPVGLLDNGLEIARFIIWLSAGVVLAILFVYDAKWYILPLNINLVLIGIGTVESLLVIIGSTDKIESIINIIISVSILGGIYFILNKISQGKWVGDGDAVLGIGLALLLADWKLAFIALFAANLVGCLIVIPGLVTRKLNRDSHIPLGPLLIIGCIIAKLAGDYLVNAFFLSLI